MPFIPAGSPSHPFLANVLGYSSLDKHLSDEMTEDDQDGRSVGSSDGPPIDGALVSDSESFNECDSSESSDSSSSNIVPYKFPYDILSADEVKALLLSRVGSTAVTTGKVPGPHPSPSKVAKRRETLHWLDEHPDVLEGQAGSDQSSDDTSLHNAILSGATSRAFLRGLEEEEKAAAKLGHQNESKYVQ